MATLQIGGATYRVVRKLDIFRQSAVGSKISPLLASGFGELLPLIVMALRGGFNTLGAESADKIGQIITPVARELAKMTDEDRRLIIGTCLSLVDRKDDGKDGWAPVWNAEAGRAMFDELNYDLAMTLKIVGLALEETFGSFLPAPLLHLLAVLRGA